MAKMIFLDNYQQIDLDKHGVIEASAGTGKTYTIENLIVEILLNRKCKPVEIAAVTFTEKATGELKQRIRKTFEQRIINSSLEKYDPEFVTGILENLDSINISTIHGFCNKIINEYSFENKEVFERELIDNNTIYKKILFKQMRNWQSEIYRKNFSKILEISNFSVNPEGFIKLVLQMVKRYKKHCGDRLIPEPVYENDILDKMFDDFEKLFLQVVSLTGEVPDNPAAHNLYVKYSNISSILNARSIKARLASIIEPFLKMVKVYNIDKNIYKGFKKLYLTASGYSAFKKSGFNVIFEGKPKKGMEDFNFSENYPELCRLVNILEELRIKYDVLSTILVTNTIDKLIDDINEYKKDNGLISYENMLLIVRNAIKDNDFLKILQNKYKYGLVDEFQDTDRVQWEIFSKIFLNSRKNRLYVVGDPKQAIYRFRGADIHTYINAANEMINNYNAQYYSLNTNWRSTPELIDDFNNFFIQGEWFNNENFIYYNRIKSPEKQIKAELIIKDTLRKKYGIYIFPLENLSSREALALHAELICNEIKYILSNREMYKIKQNDSTERYINENDICIIVKKQKEALKIEKVLKQNNIKTSIYKKANLYQSNEALQLYYFLYSIAYSNSRDSFKKALLTDFFDIKYNKIYKADSISGNTKIYRLFDKCIKLAEKKLWQQMFDVILYETGILFRKVYNENQENANPERIITNYKHIAQNLINTAYDNQFNIFDITSHLNNLINNAIVNDIDEDLHRLETEDNNIKIMTIHASKGLEFPFVFLYGGFTGSHDEYYNIYDIKNKQNIFDLIKNPDNKDTHDLENLEEDKRLYYVAFTRAVYRLYIPYFKINKNHGSVKSIVDLINLSVEKSIPGEKYFINSIPLLENENDKMILNKSINEKTTNISTSFSPGIDRKEFISRKISVKSFSSIHEKTLLEIDDEIPIQNYGDDIPDSDEKTAQEEDVPVNDIELPGGNYIGQMFHKILEVIDFNKIYSIKDKTYELILKNSELAEVIEKYFTIYTSGCFKKADKDKILKYKLDIAKILFNTLTVSLLEEQCLSGLSQKDRIHEAEFYFPINNLENNSDIYLKGIIDLVFRFSGKYYLLDWKSNVLINGYTGENFVNEVNKHYSLQYKIYYIAFIKWLKTRIKDFDYNKVFGGIYYLYLRGINKEDKNSGVFYLKPAETEYNDIKNEIFSLTLK